MAVTDRPGHLQASGRVGDAFAIHIKQMFAGLLHRIPGIEPAGFVDGNTVADAGRKLGEKADDQGLPFLLVSHATSGQWDVYSGNFERPVASFDERQAGCDFASQLAKGRMDSIVLIRDSQAT
jgi:hypothetical protein